MHLGCDVYHQRDQAGHGQNEQGCEHDADDDEVAGLTLGEISFSFFFRLHSHHGG